MSKKKKRSRGRKASGERPRPTSEAYSMGPFTLSRSGNEVLFESHMAEDTFEEWQRVVRTQRPELRRSIDDRIERLLGLLSRYDPLTLVGPLAFVIEFLGDGRDETDQGRLYADVEYVHSLISALSWPMDAPVADPSVVQELFDELAGLHRDLPWFYATEATLGTFPRATLEVRFRLITNSLLVRGEGYWPIMKTLWLGLFATQGALLTSHYGFAFDDLVRFFEDCRSSLAKRANQAMASLRDCFQPLYHAWEASIESQPTTHRKNVVSDRPTVSDEHARHAEAAFDSLRDFPYADLLRLEVAESDRLIADTIAMDFGENTGFLEIKGWRGWPLGPSLVREKPLLRRQSQFYLPNPTGFGYSLRRITERLIESADPTHYKDSYLPARDKFLEATVAETLARIFGSANVFPNLHYRVSEAGLEKNCELDGLVLFGDSLLLVEAKAGALGASARRGGESLVDDFKTLVATAYGQQCRARSYIESAGRVSFYDHKNMEVLAIRQADFRHVFFVTVTLDDLGSVAANLPLLEPLGVLDGEDWPWVVSLPDLVTIVEVVDSPGLFLHYLHQRLRLNTLPTIASVDELDYFMHYLDRSLWFPEGAVQGGRRELFVGTFTQDLDQYYLGREVGSAAPKPRPAIPPQVRTLIDHLPATAGKPTATATFSILDTDGETRTRIAAEVDRCDQEALADGRAHSLSLTFAEPRSALLLVADTNIWVRRKAQLWADKWIAREDVDTACVIAWLPPLSAGTVDVWVFP